MRRTVAALAACALAAGALPAVHAVGAGEAGDRTGSGATRVSQPLVLGVVSFATGRDGWVAAHTSRQAYILRTRDAGRSWSRSTVGFQADHMQFVDASKGWATGTVPVGCGLTNAAACRSVIEFTGSGGLTWRTQLEGDRCGEFSSLQFANGDDGWAVETENFCASHVASSRVIHTTDGGRTWRAVFAPQLQISGLHFGDARNGWATGSDVPRCNTVVLHTADGGLSWGRQLRLNGYCQAKIDFVNSRQGWLLAANLGACSMGGCYDNRLYSSQDGGRRWTLQQATRPGRPLWSGPSGFLESLVFVTPQVGYIAASHGAGPGEGGIDVTRDGGRHWIRQKPRGLEVGDISPINAAETWTVGCAPVNEMCTVLLHTRDAGHSWQVVRPG